MIIDKCVICLNPMTIGSDIATLPCKHKYHKPCIQGWIDTGHNTCPLDRSTISTITESKQNLYFSIFLVMSTALPFLLKINKVPLQYYPIIIGSFVGFMVPQIVHPPLSLKEKGWMFTAALCFGCAQSILLSSH